MPPPLSNRVNVQKYNKFGFIPLNSTDSCSRRLFNSSDTHTYIVHVTTKVGPDFLHVHILVFLVDIFTQDRFLAEMVCIQSAITAILCLVDLL